MSQSTYEILTNLAEAIVLISATVVIVAVCNALWRLRGITSWTIQESTHGR